MRKELAAALISSMVCLSTEAKSLDSTQSSESEEQKPHLQDWFDAEWFDDLVKIPLSIDGNSLWYANLVAGGASSSDTIQDGGICMIDNNGATTIIFPDWKTQTPWYDVDDGDAVCQSKVEQMYYEDGGLYSGYGCTQRLCIGSWVTQEDIHTTVCNDNQPFVYANSRVWTEWTYTYTVNGSINSICGFGKEQPSSTSKSFLSAAFNNGDITKNVYSIELDPHLQMTSSTRTLRDAKLSSAGASEDETEYLEIEQEDIHLGKASFKYNLEAVSTLNIGGYDPNDIVGDLTWYDTSDCLGGWNITATNLAIGETSIMPVTKVDPPVDDITEDTTVVEFQVAYPFIGLSGTSWETTIEMLNNEWNPDISAKFECGGDGTFNQFCYWKNTYCSEVNVPEDFVITLGGLNYTMPIDTLISDVQYGNRHDCDIFFAQMKDNTCNSVRLGDPFFSAFLPVFDVTNENIGLALSARALDGVTIVDASEDPEPAEEKNIFNLVQEVAQ